MHDATWSNGLAPSVFEQIVRSMPEAVIVADEAGVIRMWNPGAQALFGFSAAEALGRDLHLIVPEKMRPAHDDGFRRALASGHLRVQGKVMTTRSLHKDGVPLYVDFTFSLLKDGHGVTRGVVAIGRDATARRREESVKAR